MVNIITQLNTLISNSNPSDISFIFASYVKGNLKNIESMSIDEIAQVCNTSSSSISRLVSKMGFSSYKAFRKECIETLKTMRSMRPKRQESVKQYGLSPTSIDSFFNEYLIPQLKEIRLEDIEKMSQWLSNEHLCFFGSMDNHFILEELQAELSAKPTGSPIVIANLNNVHTLKNETCLIVISVFGNSFNTEKTKNQLKKCPAKKYLLTTTLNKLDTSIFDDVIELKSDVPNGKINNYIIRFFLDMVQTQFILTYQK